MRIAGITLCGGMLCAGPGAADDTGFYAPQTVKPAPPATYKPKVQTPKPAATYKPQLARPRTMVTYRPPPRSPQPPSDPPAYRPKGTSPPGAK